MLTGYSKELQILPHAIAKRDCSNASSFRDVTFFYFFKNSQRTYLQRNSKNLKLLTLLSAYTQASQILPFIMNAQILLVSEIDVFSIFFFLETGVKKFTKFWIPNPIVGCSQWLSVVANLASKFLERPIKLNLKFRNCQPCNWMQSEYTKSLQMLFPIYAVFHELSKNFEAPKCVKR